jgi:hypothetical protein
MSLPPSIFKQQLYSILPELQELDKDIGLLLFRRNIDNAKDQYVKELSNCSTLDDLIENNIGIVSNYINSLESQVVLGNYPVNNSNISSYLSQKISILESAVSNLSQSSTQSSQSPTALISN